MKKLYLVIFLTGLVFGADFKVYDVKSGIIEYKTTSKMNMGGLGSNEMVAKKRMIFDNYGLLESSEENSVTKQNIMGNTKIDKKHKLEIKKDDFLYSVDFKRKKITKVPNPIKTLKSMQDGKSFEEYTDALLSNTGGKKIGVDKVLGYKCDVWQLGNGVKECLYKGIVLKMSTNIMGNITNTVATKIDFDAKIDSKAFELPKFKIVELYSAGGSGAGMDAAQMQKMQEAMKELANMKQTSIGSSFKKEKQKLLNFAKYAKEVKPCYKAANSLKDIKKCDKSILPPDILSQTEYPNSWSSSVKKELISELDLMINAKPCISKAKSMRDLDRCMR
jgi:hypothetical protein